MVASPKPIAFVATLKGVYLRRDGGLTLGLATHPHDFVSADQFNSRIGTAYQVALVPLDENEQPLGEVIDGEVLKPAIEGPGLPQRAGALCTNENFWQYIHNRWSRPLPSNEEECKVVLCKWLGIESRSQLKPNTKAGRFFMDIVVDFEEQGRFGAKDALTF